MEEEERIKIVKKSIEDFANIKSLKEKEEELKELQEDLTVKKYIKLYKEINELEEEKKYYQPKLLKDYIAAKIQTKLQCNMYCNHEIFLYNGSYKAKNDSNLVKLAVNENDDDFVYNLYSCLECGTKIRVYDYKTFEKDNIILKNYNDINNWQKYNSLYCNCLISLTSESSINHVIEEFYSDKTFNHDIDEKNEKFIKTKKKI